MTIRIAIIGAAGRMGQSIQALAQNDPRFAIAALIDSEPAFVASLEEAPEFDVAIDFSSPKAALVNIPIAKKRGAAYLLATTGFSEEEERRIHDEEGIALFWASNTSIGVAVMQKLARIAMQLLPTWDCEIIEAHHRHKVDAPSGTALTLAKTLRDAQTEKGAFITERASQRKARAAHDIGIVSLRGGSVVGEHSAIWYGPHERIEIKHIAEDRQLFARGALEIAAWLSGREPRLYGMEDFVGGVG